MNYLLLSIVMTLAFLPIARNNILTQSGLMYTNVGKVLITGQIALIQLNININNFKDIMDQIELRLKELNGTIYDIYETKKTAQEKSLANTFHILFKYIQEIREDYTKFFDTIDTIDEISETPKYNLDRIISIKRPERYKLNKDQFVHSDFHYDSRFTKQNKRERNIENNMKNQLLKLTHKVDKEREAIERLNKTLNSEGHTIEDIIGRKRRGLINLGGTFLKYLFGLSTEKEIIHVTNLIKTLNTNQQEVTNQLNIHTSLLNTTVNRILDIDHDIDLLHYKMDRMIKTLTNITFNYKKIPFYTLIEDSVTQLATLLSNMAIKQLKLKTAVNLAYVGQLDEYLFKEDFCYKILNDLSKKRNIRLPFPITKDQIAIYYKLGSVFPSRLSKDVFSFTIAIPLLGIREPFNLYQIDSIPIKTTENLFLQIKPNYKYIAVTKDQNSYLPINSLNKCKAVRGYYVCRPTSAILGPNSPLCEIQGYRDLSVKKSTCQEIVMKNFPPTIKRVGINWLYSVEAPKKIKITCTKTTSISEEETVTKKVLDGIGLLSIENGCSVTGEDIYIPTFLNIRAGNFTNKLLEPPKFTLFTKEDAQLINENVFTELKHHENYKLSTLKSHLKILKLQKLAFDDESTRNYTTNGLITVISIVIITAMGLYCYIKICRCGIPSSCCCSCNTPSGSRSLPTINYAKAPNVVSATYPKRSPTRSFTALRESDYEVATPFSTRTCHSEDNIRPMDGNRPIIPAPLSDVSNEEIRLHEDEVLYTPMSSNENKPYYKHPNQMQPTPGIRNFMKRLSQVKPPRTGEDCVD